MVDTVSKEVRRKTMRAIKCKHTKLEDKVIRELWRLGIRFRRNVKDLFGNPDIAIKKYKVVIFIDSCFWHGCDVHCRIPLTNKDYWLNKIKRNKDRYDDVFEYYKKNAWHILRIWEHDIETDLNKIIYQIAEFINSIKARKKLMNDKKYKIKETEKYGIKSRIL